jgi:predicted amidohydrolase YtcJ
MDPAHPRAHAVGIRGGRFVAVGDDDLVSALAGPSTRIVELHGRTVLPGLTDAHAHLSSLGQTMEQVDLRGCDSPEVCATRAKEHGRSGPGQWVLGMGWDQNLFRDKQFPTHQPLDQALPGRPAWLRRVDGHAGWANAQALALAGVTKDTKDPPGGKIERESDGSPTGVLVDAAATLVERVVPPPDGEERERAILRAQSEALAHGLTEVHEMGIDAATITAYRHLAETGKLAIAVYAFASGEHRRELSGEHAWGDVLSHAPDANTREAMFRLRGIKIWADGALGSRGALLLEPYSDDPATRGTVVTPESVIESLARRALANGWQVAVHAIGDAANRSTLDAFERAGLTQKAGRRFRIEHAQIVALSDIPRFHALGVIASMQPTHATSDMAWAEARVGASRLVGAYAWRRFLDAKVTIAGGSDFPVEAVDPIRGGLYSAVTRGGWRLEEKMTFDEAVYAFTRGAAYAAFEESWRGQVSVGFDADLTVLDRDVLTDARALHDGKASMTVVRGRIAYEAATLGHL